MTQRATLASIWLSFFVIFLAAITWLYRMGDVSAENYRTMTAQLSSSFTPYLSVAMAFFFSTRKKVIKPASTTVYAIALVVSCVWNLLILSYLMPLIFGRGFVEDAIAAVRDTSGVLAWLVGPPIGYYFGSRS